jgi:hypothetical protein
MTDKWMMLAASATSLVGFLIAAIGRRNDKAVAVGGGLVMVGLFAMALCAPIGI